MPKPTLKPTIPGPDPEPRTPKFRLPPLSCDAHTHIFGPGDKYPYAEGRPYTPPDAPLEDFRALHDRLAGTVRTFSSAIDRKSVATLVAGCGAVGEGGYVDLP